MVRHSGIVATPTLYWVWILWFMFARRPHVNVKDLEHYKCNARKTLSRGFSMFSSYSQVNFDDSRSGEEDHKSQ